MEAPVYFALAITIAYLILRRRSVKGKSIPGPSGWPLVGYAPYIKKGHEHESFFQLAEKYGELVKLSIFGETIIVLNSANMLREAFTGEECKKLMNDRPHMFFGKYVMMNSQGFASTYKAYDSDHSALRKMFAKGFRVYGEGRREFEDMVTSELQQFIGRIEILNGNEFEMLSALKLSVSNLMSILLAGCNIREDDLFWRFSEKVDFFTRTDVNFILTTYPFLRHVPGRYKAAFVEAIQYREDILGIYFHEMKATYKPGEVRGFVDFLFKEQQEANGTGGELLLTDEKIMATILETVITGLVSTVSALSSLFLCLLNFPEYQVRIQDELDRVVGKDRVPSLDDRQACVFLEAVVLEILRYAAVAPLAIPHFCHKEIQLGGFSVPHKSLIVPNIWFMLHNNEIWGDPWAFRPERWLDENDDLLPNDHIYRQSFLAFGVGKRQCPGESLARSRLFLYVATLLQRWTFVTDSQPPPSCDPRTGHYELNVTFKTKPYMCRVVPRT